MQKLMAAHPAAVVAYDLLAEDGEDLRGLTLAANGARGWRRSWRP
jgi:DNA ligase-1